MKLTPLFLLAATGGVASAHVCHETLTLAVYLKLTIDPHVDAPASDNAFGPFSWTRVQP
ncbi:MAG TPA: hypothetical protein VLT45_28675 [Kofleriaceae bacterium]|nr:hypothetical protein [Kofleriaceae bacterium]